MLRTEGAIKTFVRQAQERRLRLITSPNPKVLKQFCEEIDIMLREVTQVMTQATAG